MQLKSVQKKNIVRDESYLEDINLVTGTHINFERGQATPSQIQSLCIDEHLSPFNKFMALIKDGQKIQKWSMLENMKIYIEQSKQAEELFIMLKNNYSEYFDLLYVLPDGICQFLQKFRHSCSFQLTQQTQKAIFGISFDTICLPCHLNTSLAQEWISVLSEIFHSGCFKKKIIEDALSKCLNYIKGSFLMNTMPERRRIAFLLIDCLLHCSQEIYSIGRTQILFFNHDQNYKTRMTICRIMGLMLKNGKDDQINKGLLDYCHDCNNLVQEKAFNIICKIQSTDNLNTLFQAMDTDNLSKLSIIVDVLNQIVKTFQQAIMSDTKLQNKLIALVNRVLRLKKHNLIHGIFTNFPLMIKVIHEPIFCQQSIDIQHQGTFNELIYLVTLIRKQSVYGQFKNMVLKGLKFHNYEVSCVDRMKDLVKLFDLHSDQQIAVYLLLCYKMLENSKWKYLQVLMSRMSQSKVCQKNYDKISTWLLKALSNAPFYLLPQILDIALHAILVSRKSLEFLLSIKEKLMNSKFWIHRRNYLMLYFHIKTYSSFQFQRLIPIYNYRHLLQDKTSELKMHFLLLISNSQQLFYQNSSLIDPTSTSEKNSIKETLVKLCQDEDDQVRIRAPKILKKIYQTDKMTDQISINWARNQQLLMNEEKLAQVQLNKKKHIKTEKDISFRTSTKKTTPLGEGRKSLNIKEFKVGNIIPIEGNTHKIQPKDIKKSYLYRCSSVQTKLPLPSIKKKL